VQKLINRIAAGLLALPIAFAAASAHAETVLKLANFVPPAHVVNPSVVTPFAEAVKAQTNGDLTVQVYHSGELGAGPTEQYVRVLNGVADIVWGVTGYTSSQFAKTMLMELPGGFPDVGKGYEAFWRAYDSGDLKSEFPGTKPLAVWTAEPNIIIMRNKEIRTPADFKGLKIRVSGSVPGQVLEALGAVPVQMGAAETYNALQTGLIDGTVTGASAVNDFKFDEVANVFVTGPQLGSVSFYLVMSQAKYDSLSDTQKKAIDDNSGPSLSAKGEAGWNERATQTIERLKGTAGKTVIELTPEQSKAFDDITLALRDKVIAQVGGEAAFKAMQGN